MKLSICIPTYNRSEHLANCLNSIALSHRRSECDVEICVSDNGSTDGTEEVVRRAHSAMKIKYRRNPRNLGHARNYLNAVEMAEGEFAWVIGDDDLLLPEAVAELNALLDQNGDVDFFYVNSFHLTTEFVRDFPRPFDTANLPADMTPFSTWPHTGPLRFMELIDPRVSFDFLGGMYLAVFRRENWMKNVNAIEPDAMSDLRVFSCFDNTFPHVKIFSRAFAKSKAYFHAKPLSVCLSGAREWSPMYPMVHSVRLVEALGEYRRNGLPYLKYLRCRNYALNNFIPDLGWMFFNKKRSGYEYINPVRLILTNCLFPNFYFSFVNYLVRKTKCLLSEESANHEEMERRSQCTTKKI